MHLSPVCLSLGRGIEPALGRNLPPGSALWGSAAEWSESHNLVESACGDLTESSDISGTSISGNEYGLLTTGDGYLEDRQKAIDRWKELTGQEYSGHSWPKGSYIPLEQLWFNASPLCTAMLRTGKRSPMDRQGLVRLDIPGLPSDIHHERPSFDGRYGEHLPPVPERSCYDSPFEGLDESGGDKNRLYGQSLVSPPEPEVRVRSAENGYFVSTATRYWIQVFGILVPDNAVRYPRCRQVAQVNLSVGQRRLRYVVDGSIRRTLPKPLPVSCINPAFRFQSTPWVTKANFHCSSILQELWAVLAHDRGDRTNSVTGIPHRQDLPRKYACITSTDPD